LDWTRLIFLALIEIDRLVRIGRRQVG